MWFLSKKPYPPKGDLRIELNWRVSTAQIDGRRVVIRLNEGADVVIHHPGYTDRISIVLSLKEPNEQGMPSLEEKQKLQVIEDRLQALVCHDQEALLVAVITGNGQHEFLCYFGEQVRFNTRTTSYIMNELVELDEYAVSFNYATEYEWERYQQIKYGHYTPISSGQEQ